MKIIIKNIIAYSIIFLLLNSCWKVGSPYYNGKIYEYNDFSKAELDNTMKGVLLHNPKYIIPFYKKTFSDGTNPYFNSGQMLSNTTNILYDYYKNYNNYIQNPKENAEERNKQLLSYYRKDTYFVNLDDYNLYLYTHIFAFQVKEKRIRRLFILSVYYYDLNTYKLYTELSCKEQDRIVSIYEKEILSKFDSTLKADYPNRIIDWD